jgi:hypothetical protein
MFVCVPISGSLSTSALFSRPSSLARISRRKPEAARISNKARQASSVAKPFPVRRSPANQTKEPRWLTSEQPGLSLNDPRKSKTPEPRSHSPLLCIHLGPLIDFTPKSHPPRSRSQSRRSPQASSPSCSALHAAPSRPRPQPRHPRPPKKQPGQPQKPTPSS